MPCIRDVINSVLPESQGSEAMNTEFHSKSQYWYAEDLGQVSASQKAIITTSRSIM